MKTVKLTCGIVGVVGVVLLLAACAANPPRPSATPTSTPAPAAPQSTATAIPSTATPTVIPSATPTATPTPYPLSIPSLRQRDYPGSDLTIEQTLPPAVDYSRYVVSYQSDGLKIFALLTVPTGEKPLSGWPVIVFNHGYIPPAQYRTTERYVAYQDELARAGYITFKSDYRGNGSSEGTPSGHFAPGYTIDVLNAVGSLKKYVEADPNRIGMWGHSLGGEIALRAMVISQDIKAGVIWAGTVAPLAEQLSMWGGGTSRGAHSPGATSTGSSDLAEQYGTPEENPDFWASLSANSYLGDLSGPLQLHHGTADAEVPLSFSQGLYDQVIQAGQTAELYTYPGSDHNISLGFDLAMQRTIEFFDKYVKGS